MKRGIVADIGGTVFWGCLLCALLIPVVTGGGYWLLSHLFWAIDTLVGQPHPLP